MAVLRGPDHVFELANAAFYRLVGHRDIVGKSIAEALPEIPEQGFIELLDRVLETGEPHVGTAVPVLFQREAGNPLEERYVDFIFQPFMATGGDVAASSSRATTSPIASAPRTHCARPTGARTSSSRRWRTSCAIRSRRSATRPGSARCRARPTRR